MLYDLQGAQSIDHRDRGVARYVVELARALERRAPERVGAYLLNPDLALPSGIEPLVASGKLRFADDPDVYAGAALLHLASPHGQLAILRAPEHPRRLAPARRQS